MVKRGLRYFGGTALILTFACRLAPIVHAEAIVVLEYRQSDAAGDESSNTHPFRMNPDYTAQHKVMQDETLSHIIANYYGGSDIDRAFVQMAIIRTNKSAFAGKVLHLPSLNEIRAMIVRQQSPQNAGSIAGDNREHIFFFGS
jgi:hypothetical protein